MPAPSLLHTYRCPDTDGARRRLRDWYLSPLGQWVAESERVLLDQVLSNLFGYHLVQVGQPAPMDLLSATRVLHSTVLMLDPCERELPPGSKAELAVGRETTLPLASDAVDVLLLPHTLDFSVNPHQVLREADRVLIPEGHLVVLGFNPLGLWGLIRLGLGWRGRVPWCGRFISTVKLKDWLALLGFDTILVRGYFYRPPLQRIAVMDRLQFIERFGERYELPFGAGYLLVAKKRVATLTPIRPRWRPRRALLPGRLAKPTMQNRCDD